MSRWGGVVLLWRAMLGRAGPPPEAEAPALLFPFHLREDQAGAGGHYFLVEHNPRGRFLRITLEDAVASRLQLKHIPHRVVDRAVLSSFLPDVHLIAGRIHQGIIRECLNSRNEYREIAAHQHALFDHLRQGGLNNLQTLHFCWPTDAIRTLLMEKQENDAGPSDSLGLLIKAIQLLEDPQILAFLAQGDCIEMISAGFQVFFDLSRHGTCLNVSLDTPRTFLTLDDYLHRMPALGQAAAGRQGALAGVRLFLIHHPTAEVIGLLKAFSAAGCPALTTFFVKYAGVVPESYLETLMSLPGDRFGFYGLQKFESRQRLAGHYAFSRQFAPLSGLDGIDEALLAGDWDFFGAMRLAAGHLFLREVLAARRRGEKIILVEDGGYLAPPLNRFCLEGRAVGDVFAHFRLAAPAAEARHPFADWLAEAYLGSAEHTRNGYDYNKEVQDEFGKLAFPVVSIAVSDLKRGPEARECAAAILAATEAIMHRLGLLLSRRSVVLLGSSGAIGGCLKRELRNRLEGGRLYGVDTAAAVGAKENGGVPEVRTLDELGPDVLAGADLFIGVIGRSILAARHLERLLLQGLGKRLFFVSGSTKTVEFTDLGNYLQALRDDSDPRIGGRPVRIAWQALRDLQTGALQGYEIALSFPDDPARDKTLYLLGELTPINFLYYGIPGEIVDEVMAQLFNVTCGLVRRQRSGEGLAPELLAVDRQIDADANPCRGGVEK